MSKPVTITRLRAALPKIGTAVIGWKKCFDKKHQNPVLVKLLIPAKARRLMGREDVCCTKLNVLRKCRASAAKVLGIYELHTEKPLKTNAYSARGASQFGVVQFRKDDDFPYNAEGDVRWRKFLRSRLVYRVGDVIKIKDYNSFPLMCSHGVHFFLTKHQAYHYEFG